MNNNKILANIAFIIAISPFKLITNHSLVWAIVPIVLIPVGIYFLRKNSNYISEDKYYNSLGKHLNKKSDKLKENN